MVKHELSLTEIVERGEFYLSEVSNEEKRKIILGLIREFGLEAQYELMKKDGEWMSWRATSDEIKIHYEENVKRFPEEVSTVPKMYLRCWGDGKGRVAVIKFEKDVLKMM